MKKETLKNKKILLTGSIALILMFIVICTLLTPYAMITREIHRHNGNICEASEYYLEQGEVNKSYDKSTDVMGIYGDTYKIVQYDYRPFGIESSVKKYGYYYSPEDIAVPYCNEDILLTKLSEDEWQWDGENSSRGKIKKISDCFYYYEVKDE